MGGRRLISALAGASAWVLLATACSGNGSPAPATTEQPLPPALAALLATPSAGNDRTIGDDQFEVWICHVPLDTSAALYGGLPLRLPLTPQGVTNVVKARVTPYFEALSHGLYRPVFTAGGEVTIAADDEPQACVDGAIEGAADDTEAVFVVADAEHGHDQSGGFGSRGEPCPGAGACSVTATRRVAYVGASDFHPEWATEPPMDLVEHEIGHSLGWVHSGIDDAGSYLSGLDLMSNSAAPRDVDPERRDGPGTLAINLFLAGWLPADQVVVATGAVTGKLAPSNGVDGWRLVLLDAGDGLLYTVELLTADGLNDHLPADGIAIHSVQIVDGALAPIVPMVGEPPYMELLQPGADLKVGGWNLTVSEDWTISARLLPAP